MDGDASMAKRLDTIIVYLHKMDRRDRMRSIGATVRLLLSVGYFAIFAWSTWYVFTHSAELMKAMTEQTMSAMGASGSAGMDGLYEQMKNAFQNGDIRLK